MTPAVLLVGAAAEALAPRLAISGYRPLRPGPSESALQDLSPQVSGASPPGAGPIPPDDASLPDMGQRAPGRSAGVPLAALILSPGEEGQIQALRRRWGAVPILLGLHEDTVEGRSRTLLGGADDFWLTGLGPSDLLTRLRLHRQLPRPIPLPPERLQVADLQLIPASRQVLRGQRCIALTVREYQLLLLLLKHRGRVLGRDQILEAVWPDQQGRASNVIEVYVRYLRQKLEQAGERRLIHTVRGRGYCLHDGPPPPPDSP